jgi:peptide/nickel transport system substrate-binding protein
VPLLEDYAAHLVDEARAGRLTRRELIGRASAIGLAAPVVAGLLAACGAGGRTRSGQAPTPLRRGGTVVIGTNQPPTAPDPWFVFESGGVVTSQIAGEYLTRPGPDNVLQPSLAEHWAPGATTREWTFTIREGVRFHDGHPLTAADVARTFDTIADPRNGSSALSALGGVLSAGNVEQVDGRRVRFHLDRPFADFPYLVSTYTYSAVILPAGYRRGSFAKGGIGTGPFVLRSYDPGRRAEFTRNPHYWRPGLPYLDGITLRYFEDYEAIVLGLQAGELGLSLETRYQGAQALFEDPGVKVLSSPSSAYRAVHLRVDRPPLDDVRVRQAVAACLDRPALIEGLYHGLAQIGNDHAFAPVYPTYPPGLPQRRQDHALARRLLAAAGHERGLPLEVTVERFEDVPAYGVFLRDMCKPAGIDVQLRSLTQAAYYGKGADQPWGCVPAGITDWASRGTASQTIGPAYRCKGVWNSAHWCDPAFERLMAAFDGELDLGRRRALAAEAAHIQHEAVPALIAYWLDDLRSSRTGVHGLNSSPRPDLALLWRSG